MFLSIIIPTFNEAEMIAMTINHIKNCISHENYEIIISDGGSTDDTLLIAKNQNVKVLNSPIKGRSNCE